MDRPVASPGVLLVAAAVAVLALVGCGADEPTAAPSDPTSSPASSPTSSPTGATTTGDATGPTAAEPTPAPPATDGPFDLCTVDPAAVSRALGWTFESSSGSDLTGDCTFTFAEAYVNLIHDPPSVSELRDQSAAFGYVDIEDVRGLGPDAFSAVLPDPDETTAAVGAGRGATVLFLNGFADGSMPPEELVEGLSILARLALDAEAPR